MAPTDAPMADQALLEIARRLLDEGETTPSSDEEAVAWVAVAEYLDGRIQGSPAEKPGRKPDMSAPAAVESALHEGAQLVWLETPNNPDWDGSLKIPC